MAKEDFERKQRDVIYSQYDLVKSVSYLFKVIDSFGMKAKAGDKGRCPILGKMVMTLT